MRVTDVTVVETARGAQLGAQLVWDDRQRGRDDLRFLFRGVPAGDVSTPGDALAAATLVTCVVLGEDLLIDAPVSARLVESAPGIVEYFVSRFPRWHRSRLSAPAIDRSDLRPTEIALGFSGGVDSFYEAIRPRAEQVTILLSALGMDHENLLPQLEPYAQRLSRAAEALGKRHLVVESNAYSLALKHLPWSTPRGVTVLGSIVIANALALGRIVRRFHIAPPGAVWSFEGTHPDLDPLWSTESLAVVHDSGPDRFEKTRAVADVPIAMETLHVCSERRSEPGNCGRCAKCVVTALSLSASGQDRCRTLPVPSARIVRRTNVVDDWVPSFEVLLDRTTDDEMRRAIRAALRRARLRRPLRPLGSLLRRAGFRRQPR